jgi:hypothetical protein
MATDVSGTFPADLLRRIRVLKARQRIEDASRRLLQETESDGEERPHSNVKTRLLLLVCNVAPDQWWERYRLAERAKAVYAGTSDVLHTRRTYIDIPEALLHAWEEVVDELDAVVSTISDSRR